MKILAKVHELCPVISGTSSNGNDWEKQILVVETMDTEPKMLAIEFMGERKTKLTKKLTVGQVVEVDYFVRCNEFEGKWYTRLEGAKLTAYGAQTEMQMDEQPQPTPMMEQEDTPY